MLSLARDPSRVRPPSAAGLYYPADANELRRAVSDCIDAAPPARGARPPKALVVPHSGYGYSGTVAGCAYRTLRDSSAQVDHVVVIGPSHRMPTRGLAVPAIDYFSTPLGRVPVDGLGRQRLRERGLVGVADGPHATEHSIEVQLPFLQVVLGEFELLPILAGLAAPEQVARLIETVWDGPGTLIVVSSDLSHHHTAPEAQDLDRASARAIVDRRDDLSDEQACGARGINGLMQVARRHDLDVEALDLRNSGETTGDGTRVVGYGSFALYEP